MSWIITPELKHPSAAVSDPDARAYLLAVEQADGQFLEAGVATAVNAFVVGCKADGIWSAIKASCILAGARTLSGALVPLVGTAPTNYNFVSGDYNRETGLKGDGSTKYLDSNRANNADPQNNAHRSVYVTDAPTGSASNFYGAEGVSVTGGDNLVAFSNKLQGASRGDGTSTGFDILNEATTLGLKGISRNNSANYTVRTSSVDITASVASQSPTSVDIAIFARSTVSPDLYSDSRLAFYSIGESLDLALLDTRVTTLMSDLAAAIP